MTREPTQAPTGGAALARALRACLAWERGEPAAGASWPAGASLQVAVDAHHVAPVVAPWRARLELAPVDESWLEAEQQRNAHRALAAARQLVELVAALGAADIRVMILKGIPLALRTTGNLAGRHCGDIDVLVDAGDLAATDRVMRSLGYDSDLGPARSPLVDPYRRWILAMDSHHSYTAPDRRPVEVHWQVTTHELLPLPFDEVWRDRVAVSVAGVDVAILPDVHDRLYVIVHAAKHHFTRLTWLVDVARLLTDVPEAGWLATSALAHRLGLAVALEASVGMAARLVTQPLLAVPGLSPPERRRAGRLTESMWSICLLGDEGAAQQLLLSLRLRRGVRYRAGLIAASAAPTGLLDHGGSQLARPFRKVPGLAQRMVDRATTSR